MSTNTNGPARLISSDGHLLAIDPQTGRLRPASAEERRQSLADAKAALAEWRRRRPLDKARALLDRAADEPELLSHRDRVALGQALSQLAIAEALTRIADETC